MRELAQQAVFGDNRIQAQEEIKKLAKNKGIFLSSTQKFYERMAKGEIEGFTIPAFNLRTLTFDAARAVFRAAKKEKVRVFVLELAQSEMEYTNQTPQEYAACCLAAAIEEGWEGPVFLQGDHFKISQNTPAVIDKLKCLIMQAIEAGFYNLDIDCSALSLEENIKYTNYFVGFIKDIDISKCQNIGISIGGEVGEIGGEKTSPADLEKFLSQVKGISKVAVQTGTSHAKGGDIDFKLIKKLGKIARKHGLAGIVQHGASTIDEKIFQKFPKAGVCEIHLSTAVNQIIIGNLPDELRVRIKTKKDLGPLKQEILNINQEYVNTIVDALEKKFSFFFERLKKGTAEMVSLRR